MATSATRTVDPSVFHPFYDASRATFRNLRHWRTKSGKEGLVDVKVTPTGLEHVEVKPTPDDALTAVLNNPAALQYVKQQTPEIVRCALEQDPHTIRWVNSPTNDLLVEVVKRDPTVIKWFQRLRGLAYKQIEHRVFEEALKRCGRMLPYVVDQDNALCLLAVGQDGMALRYVRKQNESICDAAVERNYHAVQFAHYDTKATHYARMLYALSLRWSRRGQIDSEKTHFLD